ncbi:MAG: DEAD/DEAH box helicase [Deltaproteobacteria bacterium]|nr:DEAD/DEAH box helicase [Deltaproteobacteria bacterium]
MRSAVRFRETGLEHVLAQWEDRWAFRGCIAADRTQDPQPARLVSLPEDLPPPLRDALSARGVSALYTHQGEAIRHARAGRHVVVATPTASGKSLCYVIPILERLIREPEARALLLFPTKALSRDQEDAIRRMIRDAGVDATGLSAVTYDGDTPADARARARDSSRIIFTNPDMLHAGILPHHASWAKFFSGLRFVVIDEVHTYRGVFGSHVANVLRRLKRVAAFHGARPTFVLSSATIANPREHAAELVGDEVGLVDESGSPQGRRRFILYNPPVVNAELGIRASYRKETARIASDLVLADVATIVFAGSRNGVEVILKYLQDSLARDGLDRSLVEGYRGGYLPDTRRRIERGLRDGSVRGVVATSALELGIDIGEIDACVCAGWPGSVAALWQRSGRAGRRGGLSLTILVASSNPIDQFLAREPEFLLGAPVEHARIDPDNLEILLPHVKCAAFELPFDVDETYGGLKLEDTREMLGFLVGKRVLCESGGRFHWMADAYPASHVSLRRGGWENFVVIDEVHDKVIAEMDFRGAHTMLHEHAIYQHEGEQWEVTRLDYENRKGYVRKLAPDYYTDAMTYTKVHVLDEFGTGRSGVGPTAWGEVSIVEKVVGFKKIKFYTHENVGYGDVRLPDLQMHTTAFWVTLPEDEVRALLVPRAEVLDGLGGLGSALHDVAAMTLMCDPHDLGHTLGDKSDETMPPGKEGSIGFDPTLFVYDGYPGGVGLAEQLHQSRAAILSRTRALVASCPCKAGCPACVGPADGSPRKTVALAILDRLLADPACDAG